jgi:hypothetical protein
MKMVFDQRILKLISEFSKPLTRPDWKTLHLLTNYQYFREIYKIRITKKLYKYVLNCRNAEWFNQWKLVARFGIDSYCNVYKYDSVELLKRVDIHYANNLHKEYIAMDILEYKLIYEYL